MDWQAALQGSIRHGIAHLLAAYVTPFFRHPGIPAPVQACLARMLGANARRNAILMQEVAPLMQGLQATGIRSMLLKGGALALSVYPNPALRHFADIDILVDAGNYEQACVVAERLGFALHGDRADPLVHNHRFVRLCEEDILTDTLPVEFDPSLQPEFIAPYCRQVTVEIHRGTFRDALGFWREEEMSPFWEQALIVSMPEEQSVLIPSPEVMMVHLCAHAAGDCFRRFIFMTDLAQIIRCYGSTLDWERVIHLTQHFGEYTSVYRCLQFLEREWRMMLPPKVLPTLSSQSPRFLGKTSLSPREIFAMMNESDTYVRMFHRWRLAPNRKLRLAVLWRLIAPPKVQMFRRYGYLSGAALTYQYGARLFRIACRITRVITQCLFGRKTAITPTTRKVL
jgi:hypothetical protein